MLMRNDHHRMCHFKHIYKRYYLSCDFCYEKNKQGKKERRQKKNVKQIKWREMVTGCKELSLSSHTHNGNEKCSFLLADGWA